MSKKIAKFSSVFIGFCFITCTLWYPLLNAEEAITSRTRQIEGAASAANIASPEDSNQKSKDLGSEDYHQVAVEPTHEEVLHEDSAAVATAEEEVQPKNVPNEEPQNAAAAAAEGIQKTKTVEVNLPPIISSEPSKENLEDPLRKPNGADSAPQNVPLTENAVNNQHLEDEKEKHQTSEQQHKEPIHISDSTSDNNQVVSENVDDLSAPLTKTESVPQPNEDSEKAEIADKAEAVGAGGEKAEDFPSYTEWTKKVLAEEKNKQDDQGKASSSSSNSNNLPQKQKMRNNYASADCGAKIVLANPEAENTKFILNANPDEYMINPCQAKKWFVVELCETIQIKNIETASLELFSSRPKSFRFSVSDRYPSKDWQQLGTFDSTEERTVHKYQISEDNYSKFIKVEVLEHYGQEHFCPLTLFRVFGFTIEEDIDGEPTSNNPAEDEVDEEENESPPNLFNSAKDTVLRLVKVLTTTNEQAGKDGTATDEAASTEEHENTTATTKDSDTAISPPNVTIPCKGDDCQNVTQKNTTTNATSLPCIPDARDQRSTETTTPDPTLPIQPEEPEGGINLMTNATIEYPDENLVTKLEDYEQVPVSSEEEPIVQLIGCDEQLPVFTAHTSACMYCSLRKKKTPINEPPFTHPTLMPKCLVRPSHTAKCKFLRILSDIFFKKQQGVSDSPTRQEIPVSSIVTLIEASSTTASSSSSSVIKEATASGVIQSLESDATASTLAKLASDSSLHDVPSLQPSSDIHHIDSSETVGQTDTSEVFVTVESLQEESDAASVMLESSPEEKANLSTEFSDKVTSTLITSSQLASSVSSDSSSSSSGGEDIDFRTPAGTIYIEPSSTSIKELEIQHAVSSERSPKDPLSHNLTPTSSVLPDSHVASSIKSDIKDENAFPESNIITTASLPPADGELTEPAAANIEPTRVSESPSKVIPPESMSVSVPVSSSDQKMAQHDGDLDAEPDSKGRPLYTLVRVGLPPAAKRESAIMRLNNRIKALELNVSLSSRFLDELSQRYRKQSEEMMNFLNRTVARLRNATKKTEETVQRHEVHLNILEARLENLTQAVSKLSDNMDELTRHLTDRQMVWASIEMAILTLIFVVCLKKRQPSLPPSLVAKVLEDLLQTQNSSHTRRRNSDSEILQLTPNHREVVRQRSADDLACPKSIDIVEPGIPFLLGQTKEGHKKKKRKKNKSVDLKMIQVSATDKSELLAHRSVSTTQLNSAGLLFLGLPEDTHSSPAPIEGTTTPTQSKESERTNKRSSGGGAAGYASSISNGSNCNIMSSKSDPDLYSPYYQPVSPLLPPLLTPQDHLPHLKQSVMTTNSSTTSSSSSSLFNPVTTTTVAAQVRSGPTHSAAQQAGRSGPAIITGPLQPNKSGSHIRGYHHQGPHSTTLAATASSRGLPGNLHHGPLRHTVSLPESAEDGGGGGGSGGGGARGGGGASHKPVTISTNSGSSTVKTRCKPLNVTQKNFSERKNLGRYTTTNVQCSNFRKY